MSSNYPETRKTEADAKKQAELAHRKACLDAAKLRVQALRMELEGILTPDEIEYALRCGLVEKKYTHVYVLDAGDRPSRARRARVISEHTQKVEAVSEVFREVLDGDVHLVSFPEGTKPEAVGEFFASELGRLDKKKDLVLVYFHGGGGWNGADYAWEFVGYPKKDVDAYEIIELFVSSGFDVMLLLDGFIPSRFRDKWVSSSGVVRPGMVEIVAQRQQHKRPNGEVLDEHGGDFTTAICDGLEAYLECLYETEGEQTAQGKWKGKKAPESIPQLLRTNKQINHNPQRVWINVPVRGSDEFLARIVMFPDHVRATGKISFFMLQKQGIGKYKDGLSLGGDDVDDEGVAGLGEDNDMPSTTVVTTTTEDEPGNDEDVDGGDGDEEMQDVDPSAVEQVARENSILTLLLK